MTQEEIDDALDAQAEPPQQEGEQGSGDEQQDRVAPPDQPAAATRRLEAPRTTSATGGAGRRSMVEGPRGRLVGERTPNGPVSSVAVGGTRRAAAARRATAEPGAPLVAPGDVREAVREERAGNLIVLAVDASGSMGAEARMEAAKGAVMGLLLDAYQRRDRVAMITFRGAGAEIVLRPTGSVEVARTRLADLATGGRTPLAAGIALALDLAVTTARGDEAHRPLLVLVSDGRATAGPPSTDPLDAASQAAASVRRRGVAAVVVDVEAGNSRLGLAAELAATMGARHVTLDQLSAGTLSGVVRAGIDSI